MTLKILSIDVSSICFRAQETMDSSTSLGRHSRINIWKCLPRTPLAAIVHWALVRMREDLKVYLYQITERCMSSHKFDNTTLFIYLIKLIDQTIFCQCPQSQLNQKYYFSELTWLRLIYNRTSFGKQFSLREFKRPNKSSHEQDFEICY